MKKLRIVICDSNQQELEEYANICRSVCIKADIPIELKMYSNSEDLLFDMEDDAFCALVNIVIIDPENGFAAIPKTIRKSGYDGLILYLSHSTKSERYHQAFDAEAFNFMQKGNDAKTLARFQTIFETSLSAARQLERQYIVVSCAGEYKQIEIKDIYYFEGTMDHMVRIEYSGGFFHFPSTLQKLEERLRDHGFVRCHRSFIVSIDAVRQLEFKELTLNNGRKIPVSRSYYASLKSAMDRWQL